MDEHQGFPTITVRVFPDDPQNLLLTNAPAYAYTMQNIPEG